MSVNHRCCPARPGRQFGFTLIEIMIALVIELLISGGAINIFVASKQTFRMQEAFSGIQENGRFAMGTLEIVMK